MDRIFGATVLENINVKVTPVLEGVVVEVTVFPKVVVIIGRLRWHIRLLGQPVVKCDCCWDAAAEVGVALV